MDQQITMGIRTIMGVRRIRRFGHVLRYRHPDSNETFGEWCCEVCGRRAGQIIYFRAFDCNPEPTREKENADAR